MRFLNTILDIVFPVNCALCRNRGKILCDHCLSMFPKAARECDEWIYPMFDYRDKGVKAVIWQLKYSGKRSLAKVLGEILGGAIALELSELYVLENFRDPILIPIPLSRVRLRERGYNQALLMAQEIVKGESGMVCVSDALYKTKDTGHQARISDRNLRLKNIVGSFCIKRAEQIRGRNIILIDDVVTTGATLSEAKKVLKAAGASKIIAFTIAH